MTQSRARSSALLAEASTLMPGGVNSPVRAFRSVGGEPPFIRSAQGAYLIDEDENRYIDYVGTWGPAILGHAHEEVVESVCAAARLGTSFGAPTAAEVEMAKAVQAYFPSIEMMRMVSSGTEACMSALRLARGATGVVASSLPSASKESIIRPLTKITPQRNHSAHREPPIGFPSKSLSWGSRWGV